MFEQQRLLTILPARLGDTLFYTPAIALLKRHVPCSQLDAICVSQLSAQVIKDNPCFRKIYTAPPLDLVRSLNYQYDGIIQLHNDYRTRHYLKEFSLPTYLRPNNQENIHTAQAALIYISELLECEIEPADRAYRFPVQKHDQQHLNELLEKYQLNSKQQTIIGIHLGCHGIAKKRLRIWSAKSHQKIWPLKNYQRLVNIINKQTANCRFVITGSKTESLLAKKLTRKLPNIVDLTDQTNIQQVRALMDHLALYITPDTGVMHIACTSPVKLIALFGATNHHVTGPYPLQAQHRLIIAKSMTKITVSQVASIASELLSNPSGQATTGARLQQHHSQ